MKTSDGLPVKLAKPAQRALTAAGIENIQQIEKFTEQEISELHGIGQNALSSIKIAMEKEKLSFAKEKD